jgi:Cft2 family RNA processing exonuclease
LRNSLPGERVTIDPDEPAREVRCHIEQFQFSAHASRESIVQYAERLTPRKVLLVHGDALAVEWMRSRLSLDLPNSDIIVPPPGVEMEL